MTQATEDDELRAQIARDLDAEREEPNTELAPPERSAEVEDLLAEGGDTHGVGLAVGLAQAGRREDALQIVSQLLEDDPSLTDGWLLMAALADNAIIAQACLEQALLVDPDYEPAQVGLDWMGEHPDQVPAHLLETLAPLAVALAEEVLPAVEEPPVAEVPAVEEEPPAVEVLAEEEVIVPLSAEVEALLAEGEDPFALSLDLACAGRNEEALQVLVRTLEENPSLAPGWVLLGAVVDDATESRACLEQALTVDPGYELAQTGLDWLDEHPNQVPTHLLEALALPAVAPMEEEVPPVVEVPAVEEVVVEEDDLRARIARDLEREEPDRELAPPPPSAEVEALLAAGGDPIEQALALARAGRNEDALQVLSKALEEDPSSTTGWVLMGILADNAMVAQACLGQALALDPGHELAQAGLDWMGEHPDQAPTHLLEALALPAVVPVEEVPPAMEEPPVVEVPVVEEVIPVEEVTIEEDDLRARIARDLEREEPDMELAPPPPSAEVEALLAAGGDPIELALDLARAGRGEDALQVLSSVLEDDPSLAAGWVLMGALADNAMVAQVCLEQALAVDPNYELAQAGLDWMGEHPDQVPMHLLEALAPPTAVPVEMLPVVEVPVVEEVLPTIEVPAVEEVVVEEDDLRARIARDLEREEPDMELAPPPPSAELEALLAVGGDPIELALDLARAGRGEDALQVLSKALEVDPELVPAWVYMGALADNAIVARSCLEQALLLDSDNPEALDGLRWMDRHPDEVPAFILGEARPPKVPLDREIVEAAEVIARKWEEELAVAEEEDLRARIARDLEREEPDTELAPPPPSAEVEALLAEGGDPIELATALARAGREADALQVLSRALEEDPNLVPAWVLMGALADNAVVARACLEQAMLLDPDNAEALDGLRWMDQHPDEVPAFILGEARPPKAPPAELILTPLPPQEAEDLVSWAIAAIQEEKFDDAHAYLSRAVELDPQNEAAWLQMASVMRTPEEIRDCLNRVLAINPLNQEALEGLQWLEQQAALELPTEEVAVPPAPAPPEVVAPPIAALEEAIPVPVEEPVVEAPRPLITSIAPAGLPKEELPVEPAMVPHEPSPLAPEVSVRPPVHYVPSRRLQQLRQRLSDVGPSLAYPFDQPEEPFPQRRGCRSLFLLALVLLVVFLVLGGTTVGLANAAGLFQGSRVLAVPTATPTRVERLARLWSQSEAASEQGDWATAVQLLREVQALDPERAGLADRRYQAHLSYGLALVADDQFEAAIAQFDEALAIRPGDSAVTMQRRLASLYLEGRGYFEAGDWGTATAKLAELYFLAPTYRAVPTLLYMARCRFGNELLAQGKFEAAIEQYELALQVVPDGDDATKGLKHAQALLPTPTPTPRPTPPPIPRQRIEISISQQRFRAYQDDALVFDLVCSTGEPARPTKTGNFKVLDKIPMAYSSVWNLKMPWWLGIYWSGSIENGIHALPILSSGRTLWAGFLGRPVSFGCIILDTPDAKRVYDWAQIGTPVTITR